MQVTGNYFWMQNAAQQKAQTGVDPLLKQVQYAIEQRENAAAPDAASKEMEARIRQNAEEARMDPELQLIRQLREELMYAEQGFYRDLGFAASELNGLVKDQDLYTSIVDGTLVEGTVEYERAFRSIYFTDEEKARFEFPDFQTYLKDNGYQGDGTKAFNYLEDMVPVQDSNGVYRGVIAGASMVEVQEPNSVASTLIFEDQVPYYEKWLEEKQAHRAEALKEYAAEQLPKVGARIEGFPARISGIVMAYALRRAEIMSRLPEGYEMEEDYLKNVNTMEELNKQIQSVDPADGKKVLDLLKQIIEKQRENVLSLGGVANNVFYGLGGTPNYGLSDAPGYPAFTPLDTQA